MEQTNRFIQMQAAAKLDVCSSCLPLQGSVEFIAGTEAEFVVQAKDAYGNALDEEAQT